VVRKATASDWIAGARPRTLTLSVAPVALGSAAADFGNRFDWHLALLCLGVALFLQIGVNYANDYSDGIKGTDKYRVGPTRLTGGGVANPKKVRNVAFAFFAAAAVCGVVIVVITQIWWLLAVGAACVVAAWFYTGGKRPYGYFGLGEVFVFVFFGLVATLGTTWVQIFDLPQQAWLGAIAAGLFACAVLLANNLRDIDQDRVVGKRTLTVLIGRRATQVLFTLFVLAPFVIAAVLALLFPVAWISLLALLAGLPAIAIVWSYRQPKELVTALALTSLTALLYAGALFWAFVA